MTYISDTFVIYLQLSRYAKVVKIMTRLVFSLRIENFKVDKNVSDNLLNVSLIWLSMSSNVRNLQITTLLTGIFSGSHGLLKSWSTKKLTPSISLLPYQETFIRIVFHYRFHLFKLCHHSFFNTLEPCGNVETINQLVPDFYHSKKIQCLIGN